MHLALRGELPEGIDDTFVSSLKAGPQGFDGERCGCCREQVEHARGEGFGSGWRADRVAGEEFKVSTGRVGLSELERDGAESRSRPVFGSEGELVVMFPQVEEGIEPGVEV